jgi:hypothetical protein
MKVLKLIVLFSFTAFVHTAIAQSISRSVVGSAGSTLNMEGQRVSWTVGEPVIGTMTGSNHQLSNGFFLSLNLSVLLIKPENESLTSIEVFPNPATEGFTIRNRKQHAMTIRITGQDNKLVEEGKIGSGDMVNVRNWKEGVYFLQVIDNVNKLETIFKIVIL